MYYTYKATMPAPNTVEFCARTPQGHRVIRIYFGADTRVSAWNESSGQRTPATLFLKELNELIERAEELNSTQ